MSQETRVEAAVRSRVGRKRVSESGAPFSAPLRIPILGEGWREHDQGLHTQRTNRNPPSQSHRASLRFWQAPSLPVPGRELPGWTRKQGPGVLGADLSSATAKLRDLGWSQLLWLWFLHLHEERVDPVTSKGLLLVTYVLAHSTPELVLEVESAARQPPFWSFVF